MSVYISGDRASWRPQQEPRVPMLEVCAPFPSDLAMLWVTSGDVEAYDVGSRAWLT